MSGIHFRLNPPKLRPAKKIGYKVSVLFFEDYQVRHLFHKKQWSTQIFVNLPYILSNFYRDEHFKILILTFQIVLKILAVPLFPFHVLICCYFIYYEMLR